MSEISNIFYLEVIDAMVSIGGVTVVFAFTMDVPLIRIGNRIDAFVVRELTLRNVDNIKKYRYLKNGEMYSDSSSDHYNPRQFRDKYPVLCLAAHHPRGGRVLPDQINAGDPLCTLFKKWAMLYEVVFARSLFRADSGT